MTKVLLLQIPHFRLVGSHNARVQLDLCYASRFLADAGIDHVVFNADYGAGGSVYLPWKNLFENHASLYAAANDQHSILDETIESVLNFSPETVVVSAGDTLIPTKDFGSPFIGALLATRLRKHGIRTIGLGPWYAKQPDAFAQSFDLIFSNAVNRSLVDIIEGDHPEITTGHPLGVLPNFEHVYPNGSVTDYILTAFGCSYDCSFCAFPLFTDRQVLFQSLELVERDMFTREAIIGSTELYLADAIFPLNHRRLKSLADDIQGNGHRLTFACEARVNTLRPDMLDEMYRIGIRTIKMGLESLDDSALLSMHKRQTLADELATIERVKKDGRFKLVGYLILGDFYPTVNSMWQTIEQARKLDLDHFVINVASYGKLDWSRRYDAHFSLLSARQQGVPDEVVWAALELQAGKSNPTVVTTQVYKAKV